MLIFVYAGDDQNAGRTSSSHFGPESMQTAASEDTPTHDENLAQLHCDADEDLRLQAANEVMWSEGRAALVPGRPDFLMSYAMLPGAFAYRDHDVGSAYVLELVECLSMRLEIDRALKLVTHGVKHRLMRGHSDAIGEHVSKFQVPFHLTSGMDKFIFL